MDWLQLDTKTCTVGKTVDLIGDRWTLLILREAFNGVRRFDDLADHLEVSRAVLSQRLKRLVAAGLLERRPYREPGDRRRHEYRLTRKGLDLYPALVALMQWGDRYLAGPEGPPLILRDRRSGRRVEVVVVPEGSVEALRPRDLVREEGPGARRRAG
jgi:DNA-binding HxlR family transcriptional regulator